MTLQLYLFSGSSSRLLVYQIGKAGDQSETTLKELQIAITIWLQRSGSPEGVCIIFIQIRNLYYYLQVIFTTACITKLLEKIASLASLSISQPTILQSFHLCPSRLGFLFIPMQNIISLPSLGKLSLSMPQFSSPHLFLD